MDFEGLNGIQREEENVNLKFKEVIKKVQFCTTLGLATIYGLAITREGAIAASKYGFFDSNLFKFSLLVEILYLF